MPSPLSIGYCVSCNVLLEFPPESEGCTVACPVCNELTSLTSAPASTEAVVSDEQEKGARLEEVLGRFQGKVRGPGTSFFYQLGLAGVAVAMLTLPLLYLGMIGVAGYGLYWWGKLLPFFFVDQAGVSTATQRNYWPISLPCLRDVCSSFSW